MLFTRYNLFKNHGEFVHLNMLKWALKFVPELGKKTVTDTETVKSVDIDKGGIDINTVDDDTQIEHTKHIPFSNVQVDGKSQGTINFRTDLKDDVRTVTYDDGKKEGHFDTYTKVSKSSDPDTVIPAVRFKDDKQVKVDGVEDTYVDSFQSLSKDYDGNLTPEGVTKLKPYTSVLRDDDSTASKVKIEHNTKNQLTGLSLPATGEKYNIPAANIQINGKPQDNINFKTDSKDDVRSLVLDDGKVEHFDQYTKVSKSSDPDKLIPAVRLDDSQKVKVDGVEENYVDGFQSLSKDDDGNLTSGNTTKIKPYTSVLRDDESTASKVKIEHDTNNLLTGLSFPATGEKYVIPTGSPSSKSGTSVVDADNTTLVADKASLKSDDKGNLTSVSLSTGKTYNIPAQAKHTDVVDAGDSSQVADKASLTGDENGNLTSIALSTGKTFYIPKQPVVPKHTDVVDADSADQVADKASLKGDENGNLTSIALSTGKTFNIPKQPTIQKHSDVVDADDADKVADKVSLKGDDKGNLTSVALSTGKTFNLPTPGTAVVHKDYVDGTKVPDSEAAEHTYKRISFDTEYSTYYGKDYIKGVNILSKNNNVQNLYFRPYTKVFRGNSGNVEEKIKLDLSSSSGNHAYYYLRGISFFDDSGQEKDYAKLEIQKPFRLFHLFQHSGFEVWQEFDQVDINLGKTIADHPGDGSQGQKIDSIRFTREGGTSYTVDLSGLNLIIKENV